MSEDVRIRATERSLESGASSVPTTAESFDDWLTRLRNEYDEATVFEVVYEFPDDSDVEGAIAFLESLARSDEWTVCIPELTVRVQIDRP